MNVFATFEPWNSLDYHSVSEHYYERYKIHQKLLTTLKNSNAHEYVMLALGIYEPAGNYSASEHGLGAMIRQESSDNRVFELAQKLFNCNDPADIPDIIYKENIPYLKISVGSEMSALLKPDLFWVTNVRTIWGHLVLKHNNDLALAKEALYYYRMEDSSSEMQYKYWKEIHPLVGESMKQLADIGDKFALVQGVEPGKKKLLWADAIANMAYNIYSK